MPKGQTAVRASCRTQPFAARALAQVDITKGSTVTGQEVIIIVATGVAAAALTFISVKLLDHLRRRDAESEAGQIVKRAEQDVESRRREAELEIKETIIQQKAEGEKELRRIRKELHERERLLDKRQDTLEQQADLESAYY